MSLSFEKPPSGICKTCGGRLIPDLYSHNAEVRGVNLELISTPMLKCDNCRCHFLPDIIAISIEQQLTAALKSRRKTLRIRIDPLKIPPFSLCQNPLFIYDLLDYLYLPGLADAEYSGQYQPVFFNPSVLDRYSRYPGYNICFKSRRDGIIEQEGKFSIPFGLNGKGQVLLWLGDMDRLPEAERFYLRSWNIPSEHLLDSPLCDRLAGAISEDSSPEASLLVARNRADDICHDRRGHRLFHNAGARVEDLVCYLSKDTSWARHGGPRANTFDAFINQSFNRPFLEAELAPYMNGREKQIKNPLELLKKWIDLVLSEPDVERVSGVFFLLNDFRDLAMNLLPLDEIDGIWEKLNKGLCFSQENRDMEKTFRALLLKTAQSLDEIADGLKIFTREMNKPE